MRWREWSQFGFACAVFLASMWLLAGERVVALWTLSGRLVDAGAKEIGYEIRVTGTPGLPFSGSWSTIASDLTLEVKSIEGVVSAIFPADGVVASAMVQKLTAAGELRLEIVKRGAVLKSVTTGAAHGVVMASAR